MRIGTRFLVMMLAIAASTAFGLIWMFSAIIIPWQTDQMEAQSRQIAYGIKKVAPYLTLKEQQRYFQSLAVKIDDLSYILIEDKNGKAVVHSNPQRVGMVFNDPGTLKAARYGQEVTQIYTRDVDKPLSPFYGERVVDILLPYYDLAGKHIGAVNVGLSLHSIDMAKRRYFGAMAVALGILSIVLIVAGTKHYHYIIHPIEEIVEATKRVADGDFNVVLIPHHNDEIGDLAKEFNAMSREIMLLMEDMTARQRSLQEYIDQLPDLNVKIAPDGTVIAVNATGAKMANLESKEVVGKKFWSVMWCEFCSTSSLDLQDAVASAAAGAEMKIPEFYCGGEQGTVLDFVLKPVLDEQGQVDYIVIEGHDITERKKSELELIQRRDQEMRIKEEANAAKREFYKRTITAITDGKLNLATRQEIESLLSEQTRTIDLVEFSNLVDFREAIYRIFSEAAMSESRIFSMTLASGEAATNAIRHGGGGKAVIGIKGDLAQILIKDSGSGIADMLIPDTTLKSHYSTIKSMGMGYALILASVDTVHLSASQEGTWILMQKEIKEPPENACLDSLPNTW